jgi:ABC-type uncharacterized transport system substrate-binding protein
MWRSERAGKLPGQFTTIINLKAAKSQGIAISASLILRADEVIA